MAVNIERKKIDKSKIANVPIIWIMGESQRVNWLKPFKIFHVSARGLKFIGFYWTIITVEN